jgi:hypothetical protein
MVVTVGYKMVVVLRFVYGGGAAWSLREGKGILPCHPVAQG